MRLPLLLLFTGLWAPLLDAGPSAAAGARSAVPPALRAGTPVRRALRADESHVFQVAAAAGDYLNASVAPEDIGILFVLTSPRGEALFTEGMPPGGGPYSIEWLATEPGAYRFEVKATSRRPAAGRYTLALLAARAATAEDRRRVAARTILEEIEQRTGGPREPLLRALASAPEAIATFHDLGDAALESRSWNRVGRAQRGLGDTDAASRAFHASLEAGRGKDYVFADAANEIARLQRQRGLAQLALVHYLAALVRWQSVRAWSDVAVAAHNVGALYAAFRDPERAVRWLTQAQALRRRLSDPARESETLSMIGRMYGRQDRPAQALAAHGQALALCRATARGTRRQEAMILADIGVASRLSGRTVDAARFMGEALDLLRAEKDALGEADVLSEIGRVHEDRGEWQKARALYEQALAQHDALKHIHACNDRRSLARVQRALGLLDEARANAAAAVFQAEAEAPRIVDPDLRAASGASLQESYAIDVDLLMRLHERDPGQGWNRIAFEVSERSRARSLVEALTEQGAPNASPEKTSRVRRSQQRLNRIAEEILRGLVGGTKAPPALEQELWEMSAALQDDAAQPRGPDARQVELSRPRPLGLPEIQALLAPGEVLLEYHLDVERSHVWVVTPHDLMSRSLAGRGAIETAARELVEALTVRTRPLRSAADLTAADVRARARGRQLSDALLVPLGPAPEARRLVLVLDGALHAVPFLALPLPAAWAEGVTGPSADGPAPLIGRYEVVGVPSASLAAVLRQTHERASKTLAVLADPVFERDDERFPPAVAAARGKTRATTKASSGIGLSLLGASSKNLAWMRGESKTTAGTFLPRLQEAGSVTDLVRGVPPSEGLAASGFDATMALATSAELGQFRTLIFFTHGLVDAEFPEHSGLVWSRFDARGQAQEARLRLPEVYGLRLRAELVVLAACESALGKQRAGEGLLSLSRAFLYAGAQRVLASAYQVDEEPTAALVSGVYRGVAGGKPHATALREAILGLWAQGRWRAPYYWAGFSLQGDWQ